MAPYQKGGFFSVFSGNDYDNAKKRLNIKEFKLFLKKRDFQNYDTKFFGALLPLLNEKRTNFQVPKGKIPVPNALKDVINMKPEGMQEGMAANKPYWKVVFTHPLTYIFLFIGMVMSVLASVTKKK